MAVHDFRAQRLFVEDDLSEGLDVTCSEGQANYLRNVLRLKDGAQILVFNGRDGEWRSDIVLVGRKGCRVQVGRRVRCQEAGPDISYVFAPLKRGRLDYMVQKATEMGVCRLSPVMTRYTQVERVNMGRMQANVIEAAEQCGILRVPEVEAPQLLERMVADWDPERRIIFCDEEAEGQNAIARLGAVEPGPLAVLIGPEGGFEASERSLLKAQPFTVTISLGPRIMRADTAAVAALALVNAVLGDWS